MASRAIDARRGALLPTLTRAHSPRSPVWDIALGTSLSSAAALKLRGDDAASVGGVVGNAADNSSDAAADDSASSLDVVAVARHHKLELGTPPASARARLAVIVP